MSIDNENNGDSKEILDFRDAWAFDDEGQLLFINGEQIYYEKKINELNRKEIINYGNSEKLIIQMKGYTSSYPYTKRFIKELWIK